MKPGKYDKYFIFESGASPQHPKEGGFPWIPIMRIDDRVMKGGFYFECIWMINDVTMDKVFKPHCHDCDEYVGFFGTDLKDPTNLHAEIEFYFEDEKHFFNKNCVVFIPAGKWHSPILVTKLERPIFCFSTSPTTHYTQNISKDPKWAHLPDPPEGKQ